jgi:hypothetical protein
MGLELGINGLLYTYLHARMMMMLMMKCARGHFISCAVAQLTGNVVKSRVNYYWIGP